jgi:type IV pilus assembly protein PilC
MPRYRYRALDASGNACAGEVEAGAAEAAWQRVRGLGLVPVRVDAAAERSAAGWRRGVAVRDRAVFTRALGTLVRSGLPLVRGLELLARQERNPRLRAAAEDVASAVRGGLPFSDALARHPRIFGRLQVDMVRAGEKAGALGEVLERLARFEEKRAALTGRVRAALAYPVVVLAVAFAVVAGLLAFVVPRFEQIFADLLRGAPLPPLTRAVVAAGELVRAHAVALALGGGAAGWLVRRAAATATGGRWVERLALALPVLGPLLLRARVARAARTLGTLLAAGVPILEALRLARGTADSPRLESALAAVEARVGAGSSLAASVAATGAFPPSVASLLEVGEETGRLAEMLGRVAEMHEEEVDAAVAALGAVLEPLLIVGLAAVVGTIVVALFLPIVRVVQLML